MIENTQGEAFTHPPTTADLPPVSSDTTDTLPLTQAMKVLIYTHARMDERGRALEAIGAFERADWHFAIYMHAAVMHARSLPCRWNDRKGVIVSLRTTEVARDLAVLLDAYHTVAAEMLPQPLQPQSAETPMHFGGLSIE